MRRRLERRGPVYYALLAVTLLMELDLALFGWMRCGSYFILVEKPAEDAHKVHKDRRARALMPL
jgi:hypothetical protein